MPKDRAQRRKRPAKDGDRPPCKYGFKCYRKSTDHLEKFRHPEMGPQYDAGVSEDAPVDEKVPAGKDTKNDLPDSPDDVRESIKQKFLVEMPEDFYDFWDFCCSLKKENPSGATYLNHSCTERASQLQDALYELLHLRLVGPFDVLAGKLTNKSVRTFDDFLCHWRYFYDPPEMQTVLSGDDETMYHIGYFRDDPEEMPVFLASNVASEGCKIVKVAGNLFAVLSKEISKALEKCDNSRDKAKLRKLNGALVEFAEQKGHSLQESSKKRPKPQSAAFHGAGLVVPYDSKTGVGYRKLPLSDVELKKLLAKFSDDHEGGVHKDKLQELVTWIHIANDECDYGMGLEFSIALFCAGHASLDPTVDMLGGLAYKLLRREPFACILVAHLKRRHKSPNVSVLS
ncbi:histone PARylation factor 1 isoform X2 [Rhipicephalus sanguineus]|uniref:histone PARylation factor 1 isoform X2 n=1 Tax=Rhipicephalus sanguineus TaxID=34632 RepID=UPI001892FA10|nr:histone PARylation factor 1 isoform X2 [Rhipicephalus sanguineus]